MADDDEEDEDENDDDKKVVGGNYVRKTRMIQDKEKCRRIFVGMPLVLSMGLCVTQGCYSMLPKSCPERH